MVVKTPKFQDIILCISFANFFMWIYSSFVNYKTRKLVQKNRFKNGVTMKIGGKSIDESNYQFELSKLDTHMLHHIISFISSYFCIRQMISMKKTHTKIKNVRDLYKETDCVFFNGVLFLMVFVRFAIKRTPDRFRVIGGNMIMMVLCANLYEYFKKSFNCPVKAKPFQKLHSTAYLLYLMKNLRERKISKKKRLLAGKSRGSNDSCSEACSESSAAAADDSCKDACGDSCGDVCGDACGDVCGDSCGDVCCGPCCNTEAGIDAECDGCGVNAGIGGCNFDVANCFVCGAGIDAVLEKNITTQTRINKGDAIIKYILDNEGATFGKKKLIENHKESISKFINKMMTGDFPEGTTIKTSFSQGIGANIGFKPGFKNNDGYKMYGAGFDVGVLFSKPGFSGNYGIHDNTSQLIIMSFESFMIEIKTPGDDYVKK